MKNLSLSRAHTHATHTQVHLITAHIDGLIAKVAVPLDRLVDIALQASRTSSIAKQHLLGVFENKASFIRDQLEQVSMHGNSQFSEMFSSSSQQVDSCFQEAVANVQESETALDSAATCISFLKHFNHLRRQWASKAQKLLVSLQKVKAADMEEVLGNSGMGPQQS